MAVKFEHTLKWGEIIEFDHPLFQAFAELADSHHTVEVKSNGFTERVPVLIWNSKGLAIAPELFGGRAIDGQRHSSTYHLKGYQYRAIWEIDQSLWLKSPSIKLTLVGENVPEDAIDENASFELPEAKPVELPKHEQPEYEFLEDEDDERSWLDELNDDPTLARHYGIEPDCMYSLRINLLAGKPITGVTMNGLDLATILYTQSNYANATLTFRHDDGNITSVLSRRINTIGYRKITS